jgi:hypothetical protein
MRFAVVFCAGCAIGPAALPATSPANPRAPIGQLAGAPAALRPGVVHYDLPAVKTEPEHHHHHP